MKTFKAKAKLNDVCLALLEAGEFELSNKLVRHRVGDGQKTVTFETTSKIFEPFKVQEQN